VWPARVYLSENWFPVRDQANGTVLVATSRIPDASGAERIAAVIESPVEFTPSSPIKRISARSLAPLNRAGATPLSRLRVARGRWATPEVLFAALKLGYRLFGPAAGSVATKGTIAVSRDSPMKHRGPARFSESIHGGGGGHAGSAPPTARSIACESGRLGSAASVAGSEQNRF
jgi:hypothetical protein